MASRKLFGLGAALFLLSTVLLPLSLNAGDILGDVNNDGLVSLDEAINALQVVAGQRPAAILDPNSGPKYSAWGNYTFNSGILNLTFGFSNFKRLLTPPIGEQISFVVEEISVTTARIRTPENELQIWTRSDGIPGDIVGRWETTDPDNNTFVAIYASDGSFIISAYGEALTGIVSIPQATITIDGNFDDWIGIGSISLYNTEGDCNDAPGREIRDVKVAEDATYIYIRMRLNGSPDPTFRYKFGEWFHIRVTPPPAPSVMIASSVCGQFFTNDRVAFGNAQDLTVDQFECRIEKCNVDHWNIYALSIWSDQDDGPTICSHRSSLPILDLDFSTCGG